MICLYIILAEWSSWQVVFLSYRIFPQHPHLPPFFLNNRLNLGNPLLALKFIFLVLSVFLYFKSILRLFHTILFSSVSLFLSSFTFSFQYLFSHYWALFSTILSIIFQNLHCFLWQWLPNFRIIWCAEYSPGFRVSVAQLCHMGCRLTPMNWALEWSGSFF